MTERGRFITLEGGEGAGKSTQAGLLAAALERAGIRTLRTREPGGSPGAEEIRGLFVGGDPGRWDARAEALLVSAARRDHLVRTVWPALDAGTWVVSDRFADSTMAYQGYAGGVPREELETLYRVVAGDFRPDLTLILDLPVALGLARAASRAGAEDRFERKGTEFHERLRVGFLDIAAKEGGRCAIIDASGEIAGIHAEIRREVETRLKIELGPAHHPVSENDASLEARPLSTVGREGTKLGDVAPSPRRSPRRGEGE